MINGSLLSRGDTESGADVRAEALPENSAIALAQIREMLTTIADQQNGRLPAERELAAQLGMGRRAIRRSLEVLEAEGRVWRKQGSGTYLGTAPAPKPSIASEPCHPTASPAGLLQIIEARLVIEPPLARLAALRSNSKLVRKLRRCIEQIQAAEDFDAADLWDSALHREIAAAAGNPLLNGLYEQLGNWRHGEGIRQIRLRALRRHHDPGAGETYQAILEAIAAGDGAGAKAAMRRHLLMLQKAYLDYAHRELAGS